MPSCWFPHNTDLDNRINTQALSLDSLDRVHKDHLLLGISYSLGIMNSLALVHTSEVAPQVLELVAQLVLAAAPAAVPAAAPVAVLVVVLVVVVGHPKMAVVLLLVVAQPKAVAA
jgi:hypothetical protein